MIDPIQVTIAKLEALPPVAPNEIRIFLSGGHVQGLQKGNDVPDGICLGLCDYDTEGMTPDEIEEACFRDGDGEYCIYRDIV